MEPSSHELDEIRSRLLWIALEAGVSEADADPIVDRAIDRTRAFFGPLAPLSESGPFAYARTIVSRDANEKVGSRYATFRNRIDAALRRNSADAAESFVEWTEGRRRFFGLPSQRETSPLGSEAQPELSEDLPDFLAGTDPTLVSTRTLVKRFLQWVGAPVQREVAIALLAPHAVPTERRIVGPLDERLPQPTIPDDEGDVDLSPYWAALCALVYLPRATILLKMSDVEILLMHPDLGARFGEIPLDAAQGALDSMTEGTDEPDSPFADQLRTVAETARRASRERLKGALPEWSPPDGLPPEVDSCLDTLDLPVSDDQTIGRLLGITANYVGVLRKRGRVALERDLDTRLNAPEGDR